MTANELQRLKERVERVLILAGEVKEPEAKSDLACFACILTSAMIEVACRHYLSRYVEKRSAVEIQNYINRKLYFFQNAKYDEIDTLIRSFSPGLAEKFAAKLSPEGKDAIDSVVNNKNQLAHGKGAGLGLDTMKRYHADVLAAIDLLRDLLTDPAA